MQIRASAWRALAQVLAVAPRILQFPSAQAALSSALSDKEKSATVCPACAAAAPRSRSQSSCGTALLGPLCSSALS